MILTRPRDSAGNTLVDEGLLGIMAETIASSFLDIVVKGAFLAVVVGRGETRSIGECKFIAVAEGCGSPTEGGNFIVVVGCRGYVIGIGESMGFREGVKLFGAGVVKRRAMGLLG